MNMKIKCLLDGKCGNYIFPFFWQHGEDEETLRKYIQVIYDSNIRAVCVESRPHPDFCGEKWWKDMDVILDEARKRDMKVWILDDSHFPTGYANGAVEKAELRLHRQSVYCKRADVKENETFCFDAGEELDLPLSQMEQMMKQAGVYQKPERIADDERILSVQTAKILQDGSLGQVEELAFDRATRKVEFTAKGGDYRIFVTLLTRNAGCHRQYINMMDRESCKILLDAVYEPHYAHYEKDFGKTIAGFFSDEPELGNGGLYLFGNVLGTDQDLPWSEPLCLALKETLGEGYENLLYLLWEDGGNTELAAKVRCIYMDQVTRLVSENFSRQAGDWCREHGVEYIGHLIEDNNQHARTGSSLGHYFRGLAGQDMAGIDDIGGQVMPQGEDLEINHPLHKRDGEFYHFALGRLGASLAAIDPLKKGRAMCEIFGNYGWEEGVRLEKYLADHFMVRGINRFVPHAFSPKEYPDPDCPPHFYAHGHNPQYRHFGELMKYMNRICELLDGGKQQTEVAILYHAEAEWTGKYMLMQKPARILTEHQIEYHFIPLDVFTEKQYYNCDTANGLSVNGNSYRILLIPYMQYISCSLCDAIQELAGGQCEVVFLEALPEAVIGGGLDVDMEMPEVVKNARVVTLDGLMEYVGTKAVADCVLVPRNKDIRCMHSIQEEDIFYFVNEGARFYEGEVFLPGVSKLYEYDAWRNCCYAVDVESNCSGGNGSNVSNGGNGGNGINVKLCLNSGESRIFIAGNVDEKELANRNSRPSQFSQFGRKTEFAGKWKRSIAKSIEYPAFGEEKEISEFSNVGEELPEFSGFIRYENTFMAGESGGAFLEITDAYEGVEVFVNDESCGIQIQPPFCYDIGCAVKAGENSIRIEVATTLERERCRDMGPGKRPKEPKDCAPTGIIGEVNLYLE